MCLAFEVAETHKSREAFADFVKGKSFFQRVEDGTVLIFIETFG